MLTLEKFKQSVRWHCWAHGKLPLFCMTMLYVILKQSLYSIQTIKQFFIFLIFIILASIYGYLINDLFDMEIDRIHGKKNAFEKMGRLRGGLIIFLIFLTDILLGSHFLLKTYFPHLLIVLYFFATFYSAPPVRFKERGAPGLFVVFLTQYPLPVMMIFSVFDSFGSIDMWGFALFATITGATQEIGHQRSDLDSDSSTGTNTFAVRQGHGKIDRIYRIFVFLDMISMTGILVIMNLKLQLVTIYGYGYTILPPLVLYLIFAGVVTKKILEKKEDVVDPYFIEGRNDIFNLTFTLFPNVFLPFYIACLTCVKYPMFIVFPGVFSLITFITFPNASIIRQIRVVYNDLN
ncbi:MAG: UbiA family prenyltransferase [Deltaproteobacteria bacterium]|nr:UbiA family prenyltransferase [Deltaproteobacteria bacterium]